MLVRIFAGLLGIFITGTGVFILFSDQPHPPGLAGKAIAFGLIFLVYAVAGGKGLSEKYTRNVFDLSGKKETQNNGPADRANVEPQPPAAPEPTSDASAHVGQEPPAPPVLAMASSGGATEVAAPAPAAPPATAVSLPPLVATAGSSAVTPVSLYVAISLQMLAAALSFAGVFSPSSPAFVFVFIMSALTAVPALIINVTERQRSHPLWANHHDYMIDTLWVLLLFQVALWFTPSELFVPARCASIDELLANTAHACPDDEVLYKAVIGLIFSLVAVARVAVHFGFIMSRKPCHAWLGISSRRQHEARLAGGVVERHPLPPLPRGQAAGMLVAGLLVFLLSDNIWLSLLGIVVFLDAWTAGIHKRVGQKGFANLQPVGWGIATLGIFIVGLPVYLVQRRKIKTRDNHPVWLALIILLTYLTIMSAAASAV